MIKAEDAIEIIQLATNADIKLFLDGGWGVDALLGYETRIHNDIDLFVECHNYQKFIQIIKNNGFSEVKMEYTTENHTVWKDTHHRIIDLHCFTYADDGQIVYEENYFPAYTFSGNGIIGNIVVSCIEPLSQIMFHLGYEHDENDIHDVLLLCKTYHIDIPDEYKQNRR